MLPLIFAITDGRRATLVKNSPVTSAFDISWVDNSTQKYYLADRTNNAIDLVDAATDTFVGFIGKGHYTGRCRVQDTRGTHGTARGRTA